MRRVHGWTSLAAAATLALGCAAVATPAQAARRPARRASPKPALAIGRSAYPAATWRLEGRRLTVDLQRPLMDGRAPVLSDPVEVVVQCGDSLSDHQVLFAEGAERRLQVPGDTRRLSTVLPRDVAVRTNYCAYLVSPADPAQATVNGAATMQLRRGTAPGCRPGREERIVHRSGSVLVTHARFGGAEGDAGWTDGYRACRLPGGGLRTIATLGSGGGGGGGSYTGVRFASAGNWLAWSSDWVSHTPGAERTTVKVMDIRPSVRANPTEFTTRPGTFVATTALAVADDGVVAWVQRENRAPDGPVQVTQELRVGWPHGRQQTLDSWTGPMDDEGAHALTDPALARDGRTITWRNAGQPRSATLPGDGPDESSDPSGVATGASSDPAARFRLAGRDLTVVLDRRLTPRGFRGRPSVRVVCGDSAKDPAAIRSLSWLLLAADGERSLRVGAGTRIVETRLDANVASRANWCGLSWRSRAGNRYLNAPMRLHRGRAAACTATAREEVVSDTEQLLVTQVNSRPTGSEFRESALRACDKASGLRTPLGTSGASFSDGVRTRVVASGGTWVATVDDRWTKYDPYAACHLVLRNAGERGSRQIPVWQTPAEEVKAWICVRQAAIAPSGTLAWIAAPSADPGQVAIPDDRLHVRTPDGRVVTVATGPTGSLSDVAISADGGTLSWLSAGQPRSAPLP